MSDYISINNFEHACGLLRASVSMLHHKVLLRQMFLREWRIDMFAHVDFNNAVRVHIRVDADSAQVENFAAASNDRPISWLPTNTIGARRRPDIESGQALSGLAGQAANAFYEYLRLGGRNSQTIRETVCNVELTTRFWIVRLSGDELEQSRNT